MSTLPPDWSNEQKLWKALDTPVPKTSANFNAAVRKRIQELTIQKRRSSFTHSLEGVLTFFRSWTVSVSLATACLVVGFVIWFKSPGHQQLTIAQSLEPKAESVELAAIAQNFEIIQDLDVIEKLDELDPN